MAVFQRTRIAIWISCTPDQIRSKRRPRTGTPPTRGNDTEMRRVRQLAHQSQARTSGRSSRVRTAEGPLAPAGRHEQHQSLGRPSRRSTRGSGVPHPLFRALALSPESAQRACARREFQNAEISSSRLVRRASRACAWCHVVRGAAGSQVMRSAARALRLAKRVAAPCARPAHRAPPSCAPVLREGDLWGDLNTVGREAGSPLRLLETRPPFPNPFP